MAEYTAPLRDIRFVLEHLVDLPSVAALPGFDHVDADARVQRARGERPLHGGPRSRRSTGSATSRAACATTTARSPRPTGSREAYKAYVDAGWNGVAFPAEYGGGGFPWLVGIAMQEILTSANMAFSMCPLLNQGAVDMLLHHASEERCARPTSRRWSPASGPAR